jgi:hypothetical protein
MNYFRLYPEVPGELGPHTVMDSSVHPPRVEKLHLILADWLGDDLLTVFPVYIVTVTQGAKLQADDLSGFSLNDIEVTLSVEAEEIFAGQSLPTFQWLHVTGQVGTDDFGLTNEADLVVSERGLASLRKGQLENCDVELFRTLVESDDDNN